MRKLIAPVLFGLIGAAILIGLGVWQVQRLDWKEGVLAEIEAKIAADPVALPAAPDPQAHKYLPVQVTGRFGDGALRVLVSRKRVGAGHLIISPFTTQAGRTILVDRGFLKLDDALTDPPADTITITGNLHWPDDRNSSTPENDVAGNTWFARDIAQMAEVLGTEPLLLTTREVSQPDGALTPLPVDTSGIPNDHLQYAVTWFSLAAIWLVMTGYYIHRSRRTAGI
ncbi:MAG: SURF1 family protein [Rhodobacteraceae bacterium]|nr:SURF1 family protein [Paracoccaceae bacterium]